MVKNFVWQKSSLIEMSNHNKLLTKDIKMGFTHQYVRVTIIAFTLEKFMVVTQESAKECETVDARLIESVRVWQWQKTFKSWLLVQIVPQIGHQAVVDLA